MDHHEPQPPSDQTIATSRRTGKRQLSFSVNEYIPHLMSRQTLEAGAADRDKGQTVRERLLAMLAAFFSFVAILLAEIGLYGVHNSSVQQREHEFWIRIAVGARIADIAWQATSRIFPMVI